MIEVGIPIYKSLDTLPDLLNSLVSQTKKNFFVCLSIDGDGYDYSEIIKEYIRRGLNIRVINSPENGGPGAARQRILDTTQCDYIMFVDSDDMLVPYAVEVLYRGIAGTSYDIIKSSFIQEVNDGHIIRKAEDNLITWFHGKIYRVNFLKEKNIYFLPELRLNEDAYFNVVAWYTASNKGMIDEVTYIWRNNKNSLTRQEGDNGFFKKAYNSYIESQINGLKKIYSINKFLDHRFITNTLINIYYHYMKACYFGCELETANKLIQSLTEEEWLSDYLCDSNSWIEALENLKTGEILDNSVIFYKDSFFMWVNNLLNDVE